MMKKTLLFHVNYFLAGGIEKVLIELLRALNPDKYRIILSIGFNFGEKEVRRNEIPPYVEVHHLLNHPLLVSTQKKKHTAKLNVLEKALAELVIPPFRKLTMRRQLSKLVAEADVVIDFDTTLAGLHDVFAHKRNAAYIHFSFVHIWSGNKRKANKLAHRLSKYNKVVALCDEMSIETATQYPFLSPRLVTIYNALNTEKVRQMAAEPLGEERLAGRDFVVSVGRLHESQKDFTTLIKAYAHCVRHHHISEALVIVGDGGDRGILERLTIDEGVGARVTFTGFQANPYKYLSRAKVFLFSSRYEGLPTVIIEAMLLGKHVVATACPTGVSELLMHGKAGILTEIGNVEQMSDGLNKLLRSKELQEEFEANRTAFLKHFDTGYMVKEFEEKIIG